jgi:hypothetical protein
MDETKYAGMKVRQLRATLARRALPETGLRTRDQYIQRLLEDDKRQLEEGYLTKRKPRIVNGFVAIPRFTVIMLTSV